MRVLIVRPRDFQIEAIESAGGEVVAICHDPQQHLVGSARRAWLWLSRWADGSSNWLGLILKNTLTMLTCTSTIWRQLRGQNFDVVHANALSDLLPIFTLMRMLPRQRRPLLVGTARSPAAVGPGWKNRLRSNVIKLFCDGFVCISRAHLSQLVAHGVDPHQLVFVPNAYSSEWLAHLEAATVNVKAEHDLSVLYVAHLSPRKAQHVLLHAAAIVLERQPDCHFWFIGYALDPEYASGLHQLAGQLGIENRLHFTGWLSSAEVAQRVVASSVVAFPSQREMMPRAVIEAMAAGKPVVATAVDGILDLIDHGKTGFLLEPGDVDGFASAITILLEDRSLAESIGQAGQDHVLRDSAPLQTGRATLEFYRRISG